MTPQEFVQLHRDLYGTYNAERAGCLKFALLFVAAFPKARLFYDYDHVICYLNGHFYDKDGQHPLEAFPRHRLVGLDHKEHFLKDFPHSAISLLKTRQYFEGGVV